MSQIFWNVKQVYCSIIRHSTFHDLVLIFMPPPWHRGIKFYPCPSIRYKISFRSSTLVCLITMLITTKRWSSLDLGGVTFIFLELCPFIKGKLLNLPFPHTNFNCLNQILWNLYKCLLPPKTDQVQIWLASLLLFWSYVLL